MAVGDYFKASNYGAPKETNEPFTPFDYLPNLILTPVYNTLETLGKIPGLEDSVGAAVDSPIFGRVEDFKDRHPISAGGAELASWFIPATGWSKATKAIGPARAGIEAVGNAAARATGSNLAGMVAADTVRFAPFSAATVGINAAAGQYDSPGEAVFDFGAQIGMGALATAGLGKIFKGYDIPLANVHREEARRVNLGELITDFDQLRPVQLQARQLKGAMDKGEIPEDKLAQAQTALNSLKRQALDEEVVGRIGATSFAADSELQKFFGKAFLIKSSRSGSDTYRSWKVNPKGDLVKQAGLPDDFELYGRYFRVVQPSRARSDKFRQQWAARNMTKIDDDFWMAQEPENGMVVMMKRLPQVKTPARYMIWKTDVPEIFAAKNAAWTEARGGLAGGGNIGPHAWNDIERATKEGGWLFEQSKRLVNLFPLQDYQALARSADKGTLKEVIDKAAARGTGRMGEIVSDFVNRNLTPTLHQFRGSPRAARIWSLERSIVDEAQAKAQAIVHGVKQAFGSFGKNVPYATENGLIGEIEQALRDNPGSDLVEQIRQAYIKETKAEDIADPIARAVVGKLQQSALANLNDLNKTRIAVGLEPIKTRQGHLGFSRTWLRGDTHIAIRDDAGKLIAIAAGNGERAALNDAKKLQEQFGGRIAELTTKDRLDTGPNDVRQVLLNRGYANERANVRGFDHDVDPWDKHKLYKLLNDGYTARARHEAELSINHLLADELARLRAEDTLTANNLDIRTNALFARYGTFDAFQNKVADSLLAPMIGPQSASKIAQTTSRLLFPLQFGFGNIAFPIQNLWSIFQNIPAELSFVTSTAPHNLAGSYTHLPAYGPDGRPKGIQAILQPMTIMARALGNIRKPDAQLAKIFERASWDGTLDPKFVEEWVGQNKAKVRDLGTAFSGGKEFAEWVEAVSNVLPSQSEKLMRSVAISAAYDAFKNVLGVQDEELLYQSIKTFVDRTAYRYARADRPLIFTTPAGQLFGGFKNWMMNYMHIMGQYMGEAGRGNIAPLMWQTASTGAIGGLAATPFLGGMADWFSETFADQSALEFAYNNFDQNVADGLFFGLPAMLTGVSASGAVSVPGSHLMHDTEMFFSVAAVERAKNIGRAMGSAWDAYMATGQNPFLDPKVQTQVMQGLTPKSFYRTFQALNGGFGQEEGFLRAPSTGYAAVRGLSPGERFAYAAGFTSSDIERAYAAYDMLSKDEEARKMKVALFGEAYASAMAQQDSAMMEEVIRRASVEGVDMSSLLRSAKRRLADSQGDIFSRLGVGEDALLAYQRDE